MKVQFTIDRTASIVEIKVLETRIPFGAHNWKFWKEHIQQTVKPLVNNASGAVRWTTESHPDESTMVLAYEFLSTTKLPE